MRRIHLTLCLTVICLSTGCSLMGYRPCDSLSGWCKQRKPAAVDFWDIKGEKEPSIETFSTKLPNGNTSVNDNAYRSARNAYFSKKIDKFEACGLDWRTRSPRPLIETFKPEGFACLEKQGLYRNGSQEHWRF